MIHLGDKKYYFTKHHDCKNCLKIFLISENYEELYTADYIANSNVLQEVMKLGGQYFIEVTGLTDTHILLDFVTIEKNSLINNLKKPKRIPDKLVFIKKGYDLNI